MNQKLRAKIFADLHELIGTHPLGRVVWHRADGSRGLVVGYEITGSGTVLPLIAWSCHPGTESTVAVIEISLSRIISDDADADGEGWKEDA